ncbi:unnamed protein product [Linum tenue]|uniref:Uncharacterized protein n=1 Tax=Linum tenue TaxID=586396 RepID=A0AAV0NLM8_9ROSI|nr:unnamed protein product [Linum tenue]
MIQMENQSCFAHGMTILWVCTNSHR